MSRSGTADPTPTATLGPASARLLAVMARMPRVVIVAIVLAILLGGVALPGVAGAVLLLVIAALLGWLCRLTWAVTPVGGRAVRVAAAAFLVAVTVLKFT
jgi:hypothetical protein